MAEAKPLTLIWRRTTLDRVPEAFFIERVLLGALGRPVRVVTVDSLYDAPFEDDVLVASLTTEFAPYLTEARRRGRRGLMLLHLGDERGTDAKDFYDDADLVLRNYWFDGIFANPKVEWVPNGYAVGVGPAGARLPASQRRLAGYFAGALGMRVLSGERLAMKEVVAAAGLPFSLHFTASSRDRLGPLAYAAALNDARFALVPGGNSPETIRLYDALEVGAIPIMLRSPFVAAVLDPPPFPLLDSWDALPERYAELATLNGAALDRLQAVTIDWWQRLVHARQARLRERIDAVMGRG